MSSLRLPRDRDDRHLAPLSQMAQSAVWDERHHVGTWAQYNAATDPFMQLKKRPPAPRSHQSLLHSAKQPPVPSFLKFGALPPPDAALGGSPAGAADSRRASGLERTLSERAPADFSLGALYAKSLARLAQLWDDCGVRETERRDYGPASVESLTLINDEVQRLINRRAASFAVEERIKVREGFLYALQVCGPGPSAHVPAPCEAER